MAVRLLAGLIPKKTRVNKVLPGIQLKLFFSTVAILPLIGNQLLNQENFSNSTLIRNVTPPILPSDFLLLPPNPKLLGLRRSFSGGARGYQRCRIRAFQVKSNGLCAALTGNIHLG
jgi:hypothetical protein